MKKNKNSKNTGLGSGLSSLLGNEFEKKAIFSDSSVNDKFKMVLSEVQTAPALTEEINYLKSNNISVSDTLEGEYKVTKGGNDAFAVVSVLPFIRQGKTIRRISKLTFRE